MSKAKFEGQCAFAISLGKNALGLEKHRIVDGNDIYFFSNALAKLLFRILPGRKKKAQENYEKRPT